jgi:hypothetical protein
LRRIMLVLACCLVPLALLAAGRGRGGTPSQQALLVNAARSLSDVQSAQLNAAVNVSTTDKGKLSGGSATIRGGVSKQAVSLDGAVKTNSSGVEQDLPFSLRVTPKQLYVKLLGDWYSSNLKDLKQQAEQTADKAAGHDKRQSLLAKLRTLMKANDIAEHAFSGTVTRGPKLDTDTWRWQGTVDPDGALAMIVKYGGTDLQLKPGDRARAEKALAQLADLAQITVIAGTDGKPRRLEVRVDASEAQLDTLNKTLEMKAADNLEGVHASVRIDLSHWNEPVTVTAPAGAKPIDQLLSGLFGG